MSIPSANGTYRFIVVENGIEKCLNSNAQSNCQDGRPVSTMLKDGTWEQNWYFDGDRLYTEHARTSFCLDRYVPNNNADIWSLIPTATGNVNQQISFESVINNDTQCYIRLKNTIAGSVYYLKSGNPCTWVASKNNATIWTFERIKRVKNMPLLNGYVDQVEFFHPDGIGNFSSWPSPYSTNIKNFYEYIYNATNAEQPDFMYNLCGSLMFNAASNINGKFHAGVDMQHGGTIRAPFTGVLVAKGGTFGMAALYNQSNNVTFIFLHMTSITTAAIGSVISKGTYIGTESNTGTAVNHLHVEVHSGRVTNYAVATPSSNIPLGKDSNGNGHEVIVPYVYMGSCLNWQ